MTLDKTSETEYKTVIHGFKAKVSINKFTEKTVLKTVIMKFHFPGLIGAWLETASFSALYIYGVSSQSEHFNSESQHFPVVLSNSPLKHWYSNNIPKYMPTSKQQLFAVPAPIDPVRHRRLPHLLPALWILRWHPRGSPLFRFPGSLWRVSFLIINSYHSLSQSDHAPVQQRHPTGVCRFEEPAQEEFGHFDIRQWLSVLRVHRLMIHNSFPFPNKL